MEQRESMIILSAAFMGNNASDDPTSAYKQLVPTEHQ